jgi:hypothetical protein
MRLPAGGLHQFLQGAPVRPFQQIEDLRCFAAVAGGAGFSAALGVFFAALAHGGLQEIDGVHVDSEVAYVMLTDGTHISTRGLAVVEKATKHSSSRNPDSASAGLDAKDKHPD